MTLKWKMPSSRPSCASRPLPAPKLGASSRTTSATPRSSWASLTASKKQAMHWRMLEGCGYSPESIKYGGALPPRWLLQFALHHSRCKPYRQLTVLLWQFNTVNPSLVAPMGIRARGEEHLLYQEFWELFLRSLSHCLYQRHLELTLRFHLASTTIMAPIPAGATRLGFTMLNCHGRMVSCQYGLRLEWWSANCDSRHGGRVLPYLIDFGK